MNNYTYTYAYRDIFNTITTSGHRSLKNIPLTLLKGLCVRGSWRPNKDCNILTPPSLLAITAFLSCSPGLLNQGPGGPASARTWFSFQHLLSNWSELPVARVIWWFDAHLFPASVPIYTQFNPSTVKVTPDLLIPSTGCTCYLHRCISSFDSLTGSEVNMQHIYLHTHIYTYTVNHMY